MTKQELGRLYHLNREIAQEKHRLAELEAAATDTSAKVTGLPHLNCVADKTAIAAELADCRATMEAMVRLSITEYDRLNRLIAGVDDCLMRQILTYRYVNGFSWNAVAMHVGGGNTADGVRKAHDRWLAKASVLSDMASPPSKWFVPSMPLPFSPIPDFGQKFLRCGAAADS